MKKSKKPADRVCAEFFVKFPKGQKFVKNEDRVSFMLTHPIIKPKLDEWINGEQSPVGVGVSTKDTNVTNQLIEAEDNVSTLSSQAQKPIQKDYNKNPVQSSIERETGNSLFIQKKLYESLHSYNKAILLAPFPEDTNNYNQECETENANNGSNHLELLALSLANRSAVFFELNFHEKSLEDANLALKLNYPTRLKSKLLLRKANIYIKKKEWNLAQEILEQIRIDNKVAEGHHPDLASRINELEDKIKNQQMEVTKTVSPINTSSRLFTENSQFENASSSIRIQYSRESTRFVSAVVPLHKGDIIFQEKPFASVLLPQFYESKCHNCYLSFQDDYFFPCRKCTQVKFCSEFCSESAWTTYHQYECQHLDLLDSVGIAHLGVRLVLCAGVQAIREAIQKDAFLVDPKNISIFQKGLSNYERVYSLLDHLQDMYLEDVFQYTLTSSLLCQWLIEKTDFLNGISVEESYQIGGVILRHVCQLICNAHAITDVLNDVNVERVSLSTADESQLRIATAIFPSASLMNHSCDPNIVFGFVNGNKLVVKVVSDVPKGGEIFNCYGPHYRRIGLKERKSSLQSQYFFNCTCKPCIKESQLNISFVEKFSSFKCEQCEGPVIPPDPEGIHEYFNGNCQQCRSVMDVQDLMAAALYSDRLFQDGEVLLDRGNVKEALKIFETCYDQRRRFLYKHHSDLGQLCDLIGRCYAILGEFSRGAEFVKLSLSYVENRFGSQSVEYGREVKKYVELLIQADKDRHAKEIERLSEIHKSILNFNTV